MQMYHHKTIAEVLKLGLFAWREGDSNGTVIIAREGTLHFILIQGKLDNALTLA